MVIIGLRYVSQGSFANPNANIARLIKNDPLKIEFSVPERYSGQIQRGFPISFFLEGIDDTLKARVYALEPKVNINTRTILVRAKYANPGDVIKPGRFVSVQLTLSEITNALVIPTEALIPEMDGDKVFVYREGKAYAVIVSTGLRTEDKIQIVEGLHEGDTVITTGILQLRHALPVVIDNLF
jgi:membrane fusion protein, multidrug efflux system